MRKPHASELEVWEVKFSLDLVQQNWEFKVRWDLLMRECYIVKVVVQSWGMHHMNGDWMGLNHEL